MQKNMHKRKLDRVVESVNNAIGILWAARQELSETWPTPDETDCLRFALTEAVEALECDLRSNEKYSRNREKEMDKLDELADCAFMLISAMGPNWSPNLYPKIASSAEEGETNTDYVAVAAANALFQRKLEESFIALHGDTYGILIAQGESGEEEAETLLRDAAQRRINWREICEQLIVDIAMIPWMNIDERIGQRLDRIRRRLSEKQA